MWKWRTSKSRARATVSISSMCGATRSRIDESSRSARGQTGSSFARVVESPLANSVTSWPSSTSASVM